MKWERYKNENNQIKSWKIKAESQKYKHYRAVFKIFVHGFAISRFIWIYALGIPLSLKTIDKSNISVYNYD